MCGGKPTKHYSSSSSFRKSVTSPAADYQQRVRWSEWVEEPGVVGAWGTLVTKHPGTYPEISGSH